MPIGKEEPRKKEAAKGSEEATQRQDNSAGISMILGISRETVQSHPQQAEEEHRQAEEPVEDLKEKVAGEEARRPSRISGRGEAWQTMQRTTQNRKDHTGLPHLGYLTRSPHWVTSLGYLTGLPH